MKNHTTKIAGLSLAALLALTACGDGDSDTSNGDENGATEDNGGEETAAEVFEFEAPVTESNHGPYDEVTIQVPDELLENSPEYADNRVLDSITLRAAEADEPGKCALEATHNYSENIPEEPVNQFLSSALERDYDGEVTEAEAEEGVEDRESYQEQGRVYEELVREDPAGSPHPVVHFIEQLPTHEVYSALIGRGGDNLLSESHFSEDFSTVTYNISCDSTLTLRFLTAEWEERAIEDLQGGDRDADGNPREIDQELWDTGATWTNMSVSSSAFAEVEASVDSEDNITLYAPGIDGWEYDSNGNWITR